METFGEVVLVHGAFITRRGAAVGMHLAVDFFFRNDFRQFQRIDSLPVGFIKTLLLCEKSICNHAADNDWGGKPANNQRGITVFVRSVSQQNSIFVQTVDIGNSRHVLELCKTVGLAFVNGGLRSKFSALFFVDAR